MTVHLILAGLAALAVAVALVLVSPTRKCVRCKGERVTRHRLTKRLMGCPRCKGTGRHYRRSAVLLARLRWSITAGLHDMAAEREARKEVNR
jgi:hypothetical protein